MRRQRTNGVDDVLNIYDNNRLWFYIKGYMGYEISNDGYVRSLKQYLKYPFGMLIKPTKGYQGDISDNTVYELVNSNNGIKESKSSLELMNIAIECKDKISGYPRHTNITNTSARNKRMFIKEQPVKQFDKSLFYPKFNIIKDSDVTPSCPIESINGGQEYGRENNRSFFSFDV